MKNLAAFLLLIPCLALAQIDGLGTLSPWLGSSGGDTTHATGNVGIGTASPSTKLHISSGTLTLDGTAPKIVVTGADSTAVTVTMASGQNNGAQFNFDSSRNLQLNDSVNGGGVRTTGILQLGTADASDIQLAPNGAEKMRIKSGGNVGIGTTNPAALLEAVVTGNSYKFLVGDGTRTFGVYTQTDKTAIGAKTNHRMGFIANDGDRGTVWPSGAWSFGNAYITNDAGADGSAIFAGKVGIGTTNPVAALDVVSTTSGIGVPSMTTAQMDAAGGTPARAGIIVYNATLPAVCVSTGTAQGAYAKILTALTTECR